MTHLITKRCITAASEICQLDTLLSRILPPLSNFQLHVIRGLMSCELSAVLM
jgi:hypothetical protein